MASRQKIYINCLGTKQSLLGALLTSVVHGGLPDGKAEGNLVDEVGKVVHQVEDGIVHAAEQVSKEVAEWVNAPAGSDDDAHGVEGGLHVRRDLTTSHFATLTCKDLEQDERPSGHADHEANPSVDDAGLTDIAKGQHENRADQQTPEHAHTDVWLHRREDQIELNHLQRNGDGPVNVAVDNGRGANLDPELTHVEVVDSRDQGDKG